MKWALEADDFGNIFVSTFDTGKQHRRPINVGDDISGELPFIQQAAKHTWTDEVKAAAVELRRGNEERQREESSKAEEAAKEAAEQADRDLTQRAIDILTAAGFDIDALKSRKK
jgi:hypothetical protein